MSDTTPISRELCGDPDRVALADSSLDFALVVARFYPEIADRLVEGAAQTLLARGAVKDNIEVIEVPGAFEIPSAVDLCIDAERFDAAIGLGCVIRGETPHFEFVAGECARGLNTLSLRGIIPVTFGVLTCDTRDQADARSQLLDNWEHPRDAQGRNVGSEAAVAALEMVEVFAELLEDDDEDDDD